MDETTQERPTLETDFPCGRCGAQPGHLCADVDASGQGWALAQVHRDRRELWREATLPPCPACADHPGWAHGDLSRRREPRDVCRTCYGTGVAP